jgi:hypothetical protein
MEKIIIIILLILLSFTARCFALSATTVDGNIACLTEEWFDDMVSFIGAKDTGSIEAYVNSKRCFMLKAGLRVTILKSPGMLGGRAQCAYKGIKFWTFREALTDYEP